jgi:hypothetical protein
MMEPIDETVEYPSRIVVCVFRETVRYSCTADAVFQKFSNRKYCYVDDREWNGSRFKLCTDASGVGNTKQQPTAQVPFHVVNHDSLTDIEQQTNSQATN